MAATPLPVDPIAEAKRQWISHGWDEAADGMAFVTSIMRAQQLVLGLVEAELRPFGLSFARFELLMLLRFARSGRLPMSSATARLQVHPASVTNTVDRLSRDGLVRKEPHPTDGRAAMLVLEEQGRDLVDEAVQALNRGVFTQLPLDAEDINDAVHIIAKLRRQSGDFADPTPLPEPL